MLIIGCMCSCVNKIKLNTILKKTKNLVQSKNVKYRCMYGIDGLISLNMQS